MNRRRFLSTSALAMSLSGCLGGHFGDGTESPSAASNATETPRTTATETETPSPGATTPECWPSLCEGTTLVEVVVAQGFSGDVVLNADCRDEEFSVRPGESVQIDREADAEICDVVLSIDGERAFSDTVEGYEVVTLTVTADGDVDDEWIVT